MTTVEVTKANFKYDGKEVWFVQIDGEPVKASVEFGKLVKWIENNVNEEGIFTEGCEW